MPNILTTLQQTPTRDPAARNAALVAVNTMLKGGARSAALLAEAQKTTMDAALHPSIKTQRVQALAEEAYKARVSAETAKYRAVYSILAEQAGNAQANWQTVAAQAQASNDNKIAITATEKARYHGKQRSLMEDAAAATDKALTSVPPLPQVGPQRATDYDMYRPEEATGRPQWGWRPKTYRELTGNFFPEDIRRAAGGLQGVNLGAFHGDNSLLDIFKAAISSGAQAAGRTASAEGNKAAGADPAGGVAVSTGGQLLDQLGRMLSVSEQSSAYSNQPITGTGSFPWEVVVVGGGLAIAGALAWKFFGKG